MVVMLVRQVVFRETTYDDGGSLLLVPNFTERRVKRDEGLTIKSVICCTSNDDGGGGGRDHFDYEIPIREWLLRMLRQWRYGWMLEFTAARRRHPKPRFDIKLFAILGD